VKDGRRSEEEFLVFQLLSREKYSELYDLRKIYRTTNGKNVMVQKITFFLSENNIDKRKEVFLGNAKASMVWIFGKLANFLHIDHVSKQNFAQIIEYGNWERLVGPFEKFINTYLEFKDLYKRICSEISKYAEEGPLSSILQKKFSNIFTDSEVDMVESAKNANDQVLFG
jgi:hypothetical protein